MAALEAKGKVDSRRTCSIPVSPQSWTRLFRLVSFQDVLPILWEFEKRKYFIFVILCIIFSTVRFSFSDVPGLCKLFLLLLVILWTLKSLFSAPVVICQLELTAEGNHLHSCGPGTKVGLCKLLVQCTLHVSSKERQITGHCIWRTWSAVLSAVASTTGQEWVSI